MCVLRGRARPRLRGLGSRRAASRRAGPTPLLQLVLPTTMSGSRLRRRRAPGGRAPRHLGVPVDADYYLCGSADLHGCAVFRPSRCWRGPGAAAQRGLRPGRGSAGLRARPRTRRSASLGVGCWCRSRRRGSYRRVGLEALSASLLEPGRRVPRRAGAVLGRAGPGVCASLRGRARLRASCARRARACCLIEPRTGARALRCAARPRPATTSWTSDQLRRDLRR